MRNMSFAITTRQFKDHTKTVTRRVGWWFLKPGDLLQGVEKSQGLKKGEKIVKLGIIRVLSTRSERINEITQEDVIREGFPEMNEAQFLDMFCQSHKGCVPTTTINRIEYEYLEGNTMTTQPPVAPPPASEGVDIPFTVGQHVRYIKKSEMENEHYGKIGIVTKINDAQWCNVYFFQPNDIWSVHVSALELVAIDVPKIWNQIGNLESELATVKRQLAASHQRNNESIQLYTDLSDLITTLFGDIPGLMPEVTPAVEVIKAVANRLQVVETALASEKEGNETLRRATNPLVQYIRALSQVAVREVAIIGGENMARELVEKSTELLVDYNTELGNAVIYMPKRDGK